MLLKYIFLYCKTGKKLKESVFLKGSEKEFIIGKFSKVTAQRKTKRGQGPRVSEQ